MNLLVTFNNFVMCEVYKNKNAIKTEVSGGFATIVQRKNLFGLKVLADADIGKFVIPKGATIYIQEEVLNDSGFAKKTYKTQDSEVEFILVPANVIVGYGR